MREREVLVLEGVGEGRVPPRDADGRCLEREERALGDELHDLRADPDEQVNVLDAHPEVAERMEAELQRFLGSLETVEPWRGTPEELVRPRLRELAELGYIELEDVEAHGGDDHEHE